ncbi:MAG: hypothetical protein IJL83_07260 [Clostridia bacterium]|nr:hypothetical protein [Clostridia bacterium]
MKRNLMKLLAVCLCTAMLAAGCGGVVSAGGGEADAPAATGAEGAVRDVSAGAPAPGAYKDETVYVLADAEGAVKKLIVSDWIRNPAGAASITDRTDLADVEVSKGDATFTLGGDGTRVWNAAGGDVYYQGNIDRELPVSVRVSYTLDGRAAAPSMLAGKSGRVTMRFDFTNNQYEIVSVGGERVRVYVPFAMLTGVMLDNDAFTDVKVTNGRIINDGDRTVVIGLAFPGLAESLGVSGSEFEIPDCFEISAQTSAFATNTCVTLAANGIFNGIDVGRLDASALTGGLDQLGDAAARLIDGSSQLYDGLTALLDKSAELVAGVDALAQGAAELKDGAAQLDGGAAQLQTGAAQLAQGLAAVAANNEAVSGGAKQVFDSLLAAAQTQLSAAGLDVPPLTAENYAQTLAGVIASLDEDAVYSQALQQVTAAVEAQRGYIAQQVAAAVRENVTAQVAAAVRESVAEQVIPAATGMSKGDYEAAVAAGLVDEATQAAVSAAIEAQTASEQTKALIAQNVEAQMASDGVRALIEQNTEAQVRQAIADNMAGEEVQAKLAAASEGARQVIALKTSLDSFNAFYLGLLAYTGAVAEAAGGASALKAGAEGLKDGSGRLAAGAAQLSDGLTALKNGLPALTSGAAQLRGGAMQLSDGLKQFADEGLGGLAELLGGKLGGVIERFKAIIRVSENYRSFAGIADGTDGGVKFIYRFNGIAADK